MVYGNSLAGSFVWGTARKIQKTNDNFEAFISRFIANTWSK